MLVIAVSNQIEANWNADQVLGITNSDSNNSILDDTVSTH